MASWDVTMKIEVVDHRPDGKEKPLAQTFITMTQLSELIGQTIPLNDKDNKKSTAKLKLVKMDFAVRNTFLD